MIKKQKPICLFTQDGRKICLPQDRIGKIVEDTDTKRSSWRIFKIMAEFVEGFEFLNQYDKAASFYGSARCGLKNKMYKEAAELAAKLSKDGFAIITGGGPGIMEAANKGAHDAKGRSVGLNIKLPLEQRINKYVDESEAFSYFFTRKVMLSIASQVYIFFPGGFGTLDELFEMITLIQTEKLDPIPIVLVGKEFWTPLLDWIEKRLYEKNKTIDKKDMLIYTLVDNADEAYTYINKVLKH